MDHINETDHYIIIEADHSIEAKKYIIIRLTDIT